jgi:hypothetical protein
MRELRNTNTIMNEHLYDETWFFSFRNRTIRSLYLERHLIKIEENARFTQAKVILYCKSYFPFAIIPSLFNHRARSSKGFNPSSKMDERYEDK